MRDKVPEVPFAPVWPAFDDIAVPQMVAFTHGNGAGSKAFQSYLDGHPELLMVPAYPLMYFYPHWYQWKEEYADRWTWDTIIELFFEFHASVIDSTRIPGYNGLMGLGKDKDRSLKVDESVFRSLLVHFVREQKVSSRTFLLAIHYALEIASGGELSSKRVLFYHIHICEYVSDYLKSDFPDLLVVTMARDPRSNLWGRYYSSNISVNRHKMDATDAVIINGRAFFFVWRRFTRNLQEFRQY